MLSALQTALEKAKEEGNIDLFLPALLTTDFLVVCKADADNRSMPFLTKSPVGEHFCFTVAESKAGFGRLTEIPHLLFSPISGSDLIESVRDQLQIKEASTESKDVTSMRVCLEICIMFDDGNSYLVPREHLDWWFQNYLK